MLTGIGVSSAIILISLGLLVDLLLLSVFLTEPSLYESNARSIFVAFLHMASNMFKKVEQRSANVRKPWILIFLTFAITSTRYVVIMLFQPEGVHCSNIFPFHDIEHSKLASSFNHLHQTGSLLE